MTKTPFGVALVVYKTWAKLPPAQRRKVLAMALKHGPAVALHTRRHGPTLVRIAVAATARRARPGR